MARGRTLTLLAATMLGTMDSNALVPVIALYALHVGADPIQTGIIVGLFSLVHAPANLLFGRIADRIGRKLPLEIGLLWDSVSLFLYAFATTPPLLALGPFVILVPPPIRHEYASDLPTAALVIALSFSAFPILSLVLHYPAGVLADRYGPVSPAAMGLVVAGAAMALIPLAHDLPALLVLMGLFGVGHGFVFPSASALVARGSDPEQHGLVTGLFYAILVTGVAIGAPLMAAVGSVSNDGVGIWASAWIALIGLAFLARASLTPKVRSGSPTAALPVDDPK